MDVRPLVNDDGIRTGFEIGNIILSRGKACHLAGTVPGARIARKPHLFRSGREDFCAFEIDGIRFLIVEPFNDNDVYWIVAEEPGPAAAPLIDRVQAVFAAA